MKTKSRLLSSFSATLDEIKDVRILAGSQFWNVCDHGQTTGANAASYILETPSPAP